MSGRQVLQRLLLPASRLATANTAHRIVHAPTPCIDVTRTSLLHRYGLASRSLSTCSLFPSSGSSLVPGFRNEVNCKVGCTTTNLAHVSSEPELYLHAFGIHQGQEIRVVGEREMLYLVLQYITPKHMWLNVVIDFGIYWQKLCLVCKNLKRKVLHAQVQQRRTLTKLKKTKIKAYS